MKTRSVSEAARALGRRRMALLTPEERKALSRQGSSKGGRSWWSSLSKAEKQAAIARLNAARAKAE